MAPTGTITFLFSDIEGSTKKWERHPEAMRHALAAHDRILRETLVAHGGYVFKTVGDAFCAAFDTAQNALAAALEVQRNLHAMTWEGIEELKVRMAIHTGAAEHRDGDYFGPTLNRVSRILATAHGGQVLLSLPTQELVRDLLPEGVQLLHLGEHRLRDLARPEHIFQQVAHGLPAQFPALRSLESVPNNLPIQLTSFVGRAREMAEVTRQLASARLLTLTGTGGTGKTRLSLQVGAELADQFRDGVWLVEFATISDSALVPETIADALGVRQEPERSLATTLTNFLRKKQLLLILDNCEHVVAACARLVEALLRLCPQLRVLASSREPLGIAGETPWPLPPLGLPGQWRDLTAGSDAIERLAAYEAVRLFAERAVAAWPRFELSNENVAVVAQICWRLDGIPLAIELAAARVRVLTVQQIAERLDNRFHLLTTGSRTAVPRQQTLRALIDWSYDLLTERERKLLRRLSVFARGRTLEAIEAICAGEGLEPGEMVDLLTQLVDKSLVNVERTPDAGARYFMLESIWDYAREKLAAAGEADRFRERHLDHFLHFIEEAEPRMRGAAQREWLAKVEQEAMNVRFAAETSLELPGNIPKGLRVVSAVQRFVEVRGLFKESREAFARFLAHPDAAPRDVIRARALCAAGRISFFTENYTESIQMLLEALSIFRELGQRQGTASALTGLGFLALETDDMEQARARFDEAGGIAAALAEPRVTASLHHARAVLAAVERDFATAYRLEKEAHALYHQLGDIWESIIMDWCAGINAAAIGKFDEARAHFGACLQIGVDLGFQWGLSALIEGVAALAVAERRYERAARLFGAAEAQRSRSGLALLQTVEHPAVLDILVRAPDFAGPVIAAARQEGRMLSYEAMLACALETSAPA